MVFECIKLGQGSITHAYGPPNVNNVVWKNDFSCTIDKRDNRPIVKISVNNFPLKALIDTGSSVTLLDWKIFQALHPRPKYVPSEVSLLAANNSSVRVRGSAILRITLGKNTVNRKVLLVDNLSSHCIIGMDTIYDEKISIDVPKRRVNFAEGYCAYAVKVAKKTVILPQEERLIKAIVSQKIPSGQAIFVEGLPDVCYVASGAYDVSSQRVKILVSNPTNFPVEIACGVQIAKAQLCTDYVTRPFEPPMSVNAVRNLSLLTVPDSVLTTVPSAFHHQYRELLHRHSGVFSLNPDDVGHCQQFPQRIVLKDPSIIASTPPYRIPHHLTEVATHYVDKLLKAGIIRPSTSPFSSPLLLVKKPGLDDPRKTLIEKWRVVHDFRKLNNNVIPDSYPLHHVYDLIDKVAQANVWSVIDLSSGFFNQALEASSQKFTAFGIPGVGHWEYTRSAQGLCNSPASFQRMLDKIIMGLKNTFVYIDDVVIASQDHAEHLQDLNNLFERFQKYNVKCRIAKLQIGAPKVTYLGYDISKKDGIRPGVIKTEVIKNWKPPVDVKQVRQFIGLCSFFRRTVPNFSRTASPLIKLTRKDSPWKAGPLPSDALQAFETLKTQFRSRPCLTPVDFSKEFFLTTDASTQGFGAILSQCNDQGIEHPCAYASKTIGQAEAKLAPFHLEHMAMVWACKHFKPYLSGRHFTLRTDHKPLLSLNKVQGQSFDRLQAELAEFQPFTVTYLKGEIMPADGLSRLQSSAVNPAVIQDFSIESLRKLQMEDKVIKALLCFQKFALMPDDPKLKAIVIKYADRVTLDEGIILIDDKFVAPFNIRHTLMQLAHDDPMAGHFSVDKSLANLSPVWFWPKMKSDIQSHVGNCEKCLQVNNPSKYFKAPLQAMPQATYFNQRVHLDLMGPFPSSHVYNHKYLLVIIDAFTHWVETVPLVSKEAHIVAEAFHNRWICRHSCRKMQILIKAVNSLPWYSVL